MFTLFLLSLQSSIVGDNNKVTKYSIDEYAIGLTTAMRIVLEYTGPVNSNMCGLNVTVIIAHPPAPAPGQYRAHVH